MAEEIDDNTPASKTETFSREYVQELRRENKGLRERMRENEEKATKAEKSAKDAADAATASIDAARKVTDQRIVRSELKAEAIKAGIVDVDGLKLVDIEGVSLNEQGEIVGADKMIEGLKKAKPYLFAAPASSSTERMPNPADPAEVKAADLSPEEYEKQKAALIKR